VDMVSRSFQIFCPYFKYNTNSTSEDKAKNIWLEWEYSERCASSKVFQHDFEIIMSANG
jgi:hypothetical protein